jgi:hypothetical protein
MIIYLLALLLCGGQVDKIPSGWTLCDGTDNTPNLTDRFIVGAGNTYSVGNTGQLGPYL